MIQSEPVRKDESVLHIYFTETIERKTNCFFHWLTIWGYVILELSEGCMWSLGLKPVPYDQFDTAQLLPSRKSSLMQAKLHWCWMKNGSKNPLPLTILKPGFYKIMLKKLWSEGQETPISDHWQIEDRGGYHGEDEQEYWQGTTPWSPNTKGLARITFSAPTRSLALSNKPRRTHWWRDKNMKRHHFCNAGRHGWLKTEGESGWPDSSTCALVHFYAPKIRKLWLLQKRPRGFASHKLKMSPKYNIAAKLIHTVLGLFCSCSSGGGSSGDSRG